MIKKYWRKVTLKKALNVILRTALISGEKREGSLTLERTFHLSKCRRMGSTFMVRGESKTVKQQGGGLGKNTKNSLKVRKDLFYLHFKLAMSMFGRDWKKVEQHIGSRSGAQIRSHAQKFFNRIEKELG